jgi:hypothetical protein
MLTNIARKGLFAGVVKVNLSRNSGCASSFPSRRDSGEYLHTKACDELV